MILPKDNEKARQQNAAGLYYFQRIESQFFKFKIIEDYPGVTLSRRLLPFR